MWTAMTARVREQTQRALSSSVRGRYDEANLALNDIAGSAAP